MRFFPAKGSQVERDVAPRDLIRKADDARDQRQWEKAIEFYSHYLKLQADDAAIWVQYGHACKELGNLSEAEQAYSRSLQLAPNNADTHLQVGHLFKLRREISNAAKSYKQALSLDPSALDARRELVSLGLFEEDEFGVTADRSAGEFLDLSDVFFYLRQHLTVSGIQRVQLGIAKALTEMPADQRRGLRFVVESPDRSTYAILEDVYVVELCGVLKRRDVHHASLLALLDRALQASRLFVPVDGDLLLVLGAFWVLENIAERIIAFRRKGVRVGVLIHDIIPITHPEFCERALTNEFKSYLGSVLSVANFVLTVSEHSMRQVSRFISSQHLGPLPVRVLRSAHETLPAPSGGMSLELQGPYVLYVSTIEIRKNHTYLFRIWKRLLEERGAANVPKLVFVGRQGWRVKDLMDQLASTGNLEGKIVILHDVSDSILSSLYVGSLFTVFPSFEEGWGLPVGESLFFGKPCIASSCSSIPEVGGEFVDYVDPHNLGDGYQKMVRFLDDVDYLQSRAAHIKSAFQPRTWSKVAGELMEICREEEFGKRDVPQPPILPAGTFIKVGHNDDRSEYLSTGASKLVHLAFDPRWYPVESFGRWMKGVSSSFSVSLDLKKKSNILVMIEICTTPSHKDAELQVRINDQEYGPLVLPPGSNALRIFKVSCVRESLNVELVRRGAAGDGADTRKDICFGIKAFGYANEGDLAGRLSLLESIACGGGRLLIPNGMKDARADA